MCSKYLSVHRLDFSLLNVRRIVAKTVLACTRHLAVERHVTIRTKALALTEDAPFDGDSTLAISELVEDCHVCNTNLSTVMSVIWGRLNQTKTNMPILLALHLLKSLVSNGPITAVTEALDGAGKIYELKSFSEAKSADHNREVRQAADHVYRLLVDLSSLFARRRRIAFAKAQQLSTLDVCKDTWSDYLVKRLPLTVSGKAIHALFRPDGMSGKRFYHNDDGSVAPSVAQSLAPSVMALSRLKSTQRPSAVVYDEDEEDRLFGSEVDNQLDESVEDSGYASPPEQTIEVRTVSLKDPRHGMSANDLFSDDDVAISALAKVGNGGSMLESFNYAVSSSGGSVLSVSQRSGDYQSNNLQGKTDYFLWCCLP